VVPPGARVAARLVRDRGRARRQPAPPRRRCPAPRRLDPSRPRVLHRGGFRWRDPSRSHRQPTSRRS